MKIPRTLKIDGETWTVERHLVKKNDLETQYFGRTDHYEKKITIDMSRRSNSTFLHEIIHAVDVNRHLDLEERQVKALAHGLYAVIIDNNLDFRNSTKAKKNS